MGYAGMGGGRLIGGWRRVILSHHGISLLLNAQVVSRILYHGVRRDGERLIGGWRRVILPHHGVSLLLNAQVVVRILKDGLSGQPANQDRV